jgi:hypothetical protein
MTGLKQHLILLEGVLRIIFNELDPIWLMQMWHGPNESYRNMIDIVFMLYIVEWRL